MLILNLEGLLPKNALKKFGFFAHLSKLFCYFGSYLVASKGLKISPQECQVRFPSINCPPLIRIMY